MRLCSATVSSPGETIERAIVFEDVSGFRKVCALKAISAWPVVFEDRLVDADVGLRVKGLLLFCVLRFKDDLFDDEDEAQLVSLAQQGGGAVLQLSELSIHERANFLARLRLCIHRRMAVPANTVPQILEQMFGLVDRATESAGVGERRTSVRYPVKAEAIVTIGDQVQKALVDNVSSGGAFVQTTNAPPMQSEVALEVTLPSGVLKTDATVVNVSPRGVGVRFAADQSLSASLEQKLEALELKPPPPTTSVLPSLLEPTGSATPAEVPGERLGDYELLSLLGKGGMGEVHFARVVTGPRKGEHVAVKRLHARLANDDEVLALFEREGRTLKLLDHPHIVKVLEAGGFDGHQCLVMEAIDGRDLGQILRRSRGQKKPLPVELACYLTSVLLDALSALHEASNETGPLKLVHGDVAPHNLFVAKTGEVKLGDFGVVRTAGTKVADPLTWARPSYLSPEALEGEVAVSSDLWAAGVTLFELLTNELPFAGETLDLLKADIREGKGKQLRQKRADAPVPLDVVVRKALRKEADRRYLTAKELKDALAPFFDEAKAKAELPEFVKGLFATKKVK